MIRIPLLAGLLLSAFFWTRPAATVHTWPNAIPSLAAVRPTFAVNLKNGSVHVGGHAPNSPEGLMADLRAAYAADGWQECPVSERLADFALFVKGPAVAAAVVRKTEQGSFISIVQRPKGL